MRLIDADALEEELEKDIMGGLNYKRYINNAPTVLETCVNPTTEDAIKTIQELMIACTPYSKYYRVGQMAIKALSQEQKTIQEKQAESEKYQKAFEKHLMTDIKTDTNKQGLITSISKPTGINYWDLAQEHCDDAISRQVVKEQMIKYGFHAPDMTVTEFVKDLPPVRPQEQTGHCKDCKWWKDSDGAFRRGVRAESQCPINREEVYEGNGYCYMFEPQENKEEQI